MDFADAGEAAGVFQGLEAVIHLAADSSTDAIWESVLVNNINATYHILEEARRAGVSKVVLPAPTILNTIISGKLH